MWLGENPKVEVGYVTWHSDGSRCDGSQINVEASLYNV